MGGLLAKELAMGSFVEVLSTAAANVGEDVCWIMPLENEGLARAAAMVEATYLIRDPRPGYQQEIMRLT